MTIPEAILMLLCSTRGEGRTLGMNISIGSTTPGNANWLACYVALTMPALSFGLASMN